MQRFARCLGEAEVEQVVGEMWPRQVLCGEISNSTGVRPAIIFHALDRVLEETVSDGQGECNIKIVFCRGAFKSAETATQILAECSLNFIGCETGLSIFR